MRYLDARTDISNARWKNTKRLEKQ